MPFLTFDYLQAWWRTRGGGEWPDESQLVLVTAYDQGHLVGIAPLFHAENIQGKPALMFIGAIEVSDFLDFIVQPKDLPEFISGLIDFLLNEDLPAWEVLDFYNILEDSPSLKGLAAEAKQRGWDYQQINCSPHLTSHYLQILKPTLQVSTKNSVMRSAASFGMWSQPDKR